MKYLYLENGIVHEIIPSIDPMFPDVPINQRYSVAFLSKCVSIDESVIVNVGDLYDSTTGIISSPIITTPNDPEYTPNTSTPTLADRVEQLESTMMDMMIGTL